MLRIDGLDVELLGHLTRNARAGVVELAASMGVARNTVQARLKRLTDDGLLRGYRPDLDLEGIGIAVQAFLALELEQGRLQDVIGGLTQMAEVLEVNATTGREDLLVRVGTTTHANLQGLIEGVLSIPGVSHASTTLALTTPVPYRVQPLLDKVSRGAGRGRASRPGD